ncbi:DUF2391 family protein [Candidatus Woesearchaeota archaeon]|nr:DUF2391 family protein [Candidatus Woesearchaeota archaeon]
MPRKKKLEITLNDEKPKLLQRFKAEFSISDVLQVIIGSSILAIPVGFTEETWKLGDLLPVKNVLMLMALSLLFIGAFTYYHYYRGTLKEHGSVFLERVIMTYFLSFLVVALLLSLIDKTPWSADALIAFKRVAIVTFPASMSGAIADVIR